MSAPLLPGGAGTYKELGSVVTMPGAPMTVLAAEMRWLDMAVALQRGELAAVMRGKGGSHPVTGPAGPLPGDPASPSRLFRGTRDQVHEVREFVRERLAGHPALDDVVLVASELAANAIIHSASGRSGGLLMVHLAEIDEGDVVVLVTDQGGTGHRPHKKIAGTSGESGRGLAVAGSCASLIDYFDHGDLRSVVAVIPASRP